MSDYYFFNRKVNKQHTQIINLFAFTLANPKVKSTGTSEFKRLEIRM